MKQEAAQGGKESDHRLGRQYGYALWGYGIVALLFFQLRHAQ